MRVAAVVSRSGPGPSGGVRSIGPLPHWASIDVDELALGIVAHAAGVERERGIAQQRCRNAVYAEVDGLGDNVLRVLGGVSSAAGAELVVGLLRPIAGENADDTVGLT